MIEEEKILRESIGRRNGFRVPDGYFGQLTVSVMAQLPEREARRVKLNSWLYAAASVAVAVLMGVSCYLYQQPDDEMVADSYFEQAADYTMIDNTDIYACLSAD